MTGKAEARFKAVNNMFIPINFNPLKTLNYNCTIMMNQEMKVFTVGLSKTLE